MSDADGALWRDHDNRPYFRHRPKLVGPEITLTLDGGDLVWSDGRASHRIPLAGIESLRVAFRPANLHTRRHVVVLRGKDGRRLWFSNISYRGLVQVETHDAAFTAFLHALAAAVAKHAPAARFLAGEPLWRYVPAAVLTAAFLVALALLLTQAARQSGYLAMAVFVFLGGYVVWLMGQWVLRNRPVAFDPRDPPARILP